MFSSVRRSVKDKFTGREIVLTDEEVDMIEKMQKSEYITSSDPYEVCVCVCTCMCVHMSACVIVCVSEYTCKCYSSPMLMYICVSYCNCMHVCMSYTLSAHKRVSAIWVLKEARNWLWGYLQLAVIGRFIK